MTLIFSKCRFRVSLVLIFIFLFWSSLVFKLFQIQVLDGKSYRERGERQGLVKKMILPDRGNFYDRNNTCLTQNVVRYSIAVNPHKFSKKTELISILQEITGKSESYYRSKMDSKQNFVYLDRNLSAEKCERLLSGQFDDLIMERTTSRYYPHDNISGQLLGFVDVDNKGICGLEKEYDKILEGNSGWVIKERNGRGILNPKNNSPELASENGSNIQLTIDLDYQSVLQEELSRRIEETQAKSGTGIIINPQTGAILAMASCPDYNPNEPNKTDFNNHKIKALTDQFEPGSTFKIVAATAAMDLGIVSPMDEFNCELGAYDFQNIRITDHEEYGLMTFSEIMEHSSNIGIIKIAEILGAGQLYRYAKKFGFGSMTHINILGETEGTLRRLDQWSPVSLAEISMGHEVGVTALQLGVAYSAIANGGYLLRPRIVNQIQTPSKNSHFIDSPEVIRKIAKPEAIAALIKMLTAVVETGTGTEARIKGWSVAGKTGTAQKFVNGKYSNSKFVSNFVGFLPADNPQLLCVIVIDEPRYGYHWGGIGAAVTFRRVMERVLNMDDNISVPIRKPVLIADMVPPIPNENISAIPVNLSKLAVLNKNLTIVPEVRGMSWRRAEKTLRQAGLKVKRQGSGQVVWQAPKPGIETNKNTICIISLQ